MFSQAKRHAFLAKGNRFNMPGINENVTNSYNRGRLGNPTNPGRPDPDTPQNVISTTAMMCAPPRSLDELTDEMEAIDLYAPTSRNALANVPTRGTWAVQADYNSVVGRDWSSQVVKSSQNPYANAIAVFTNMGGVPKSVRIRFCGIVGNAGQGHGGDPNRDNFGQVYSAGALTGRNTGPEYIPPCSIVYLSPFPYLLTDSKTGKTIPGYRDPSWEENQIDLFQPATHALRDTDACAFFHAMEAKIDEHAKNPNFGNNGAIEAALTDAFVHKHVPVYLYAENYAYLVNAQNRVDEFITQFDKAGDADAQTERLGKKAVKAINTAVAKNKEYWGKVAAEQKAVSDATGGPAWNPRYDSLVVADLPDHASAMQIIREMSKLQRLSNEVFKMQYAEQHNFMRALCFGKTRYGSPAGGKLDVTAGYRV